MKTHAEALETLVGEQLSSVEFVQDYVQLRLDGPTLTTFSHPKVEVSNRILEWAEPGYRDELCARISKLVSKTQVVADKAIRIEFEDGSRIVVDLTMREGPESAIFDLGPDKLEEGAWVF